MEDANLYFTAAAGEQMYTGSASGVLASKSIPLSVARNIGVGTHKVFLVAEVTEILDGAGDSADIDLLTDTNEAMSSPTVVSNAGGTAAMFTFAALSAVGTKKYAELPESFNYETYLGARVYARGSGALTGGAFRIYLSLEPGVQHIYASSSTV